MKKIILFIVFILVNTSIYSQIEYGPKIGYFFLLDIANLPKHCHGGYTVLDIDTKMNNNYQLGFFSRYNYQKLYFQSEINYCIGSNVQSIKFYDDNTNQAEFTRHLTIQSFQIPILFGYKLLTSNSLNLRIFIGTQFNFNSASKTKITYTSTSPDRFTSNTRNFQPCIISGLGMDILKFTFDVRFDVCNNVNQSYFDNRTIDKFRQNYLIFSFGYKI